MAKNAAEKRNALAVLLAILIALGVYVPLSGMDTFAAAKPTVTLATASSTVYYGNGGFTGMHMVTGTSGNMGSDATDRYVYCIQPELTAPPSGIYTVTKFIEDDGTGKWAQIRKFLYFCPGFYGYKSHGQAIFNKHASKSAYATPHYAAAHVILSWKSGTSKEPFKWTDWATSYAPAVWNEIMALDDSLVPDSFTVYMISNAGYQDVIGGFYREMGYLNVQKSASDPVAKDRNSSVYNLKGATYGVYETKADAQANRNSVGTLTTSVTGKTNSIKIDVGTYYVKELSAPSGYNLDTTIYTAEVTNGGTTTVESTDQIKTGKANLKKTSANPDITDGNSCYSLEEAVYEVYTSVSDAQSGKNKIATLTTDADGNTNTVDLPAGNVWVKEVKASKGYALDEEIHEGTIEIGKTTTFESKELPQNDPVGVLLQKIDSATGDKAVQGAAKLEGAQFTVKYYAGLYDTAEEAEASGEPERTWVYESQADGTISLKDNPIAGDAVFTSSTGSTTLPVGTVTITETKAPEGYNLNPEVFVRQITPDGLIETVGTYNTPEIPEDVIRGDLKFVKVADRTLFRMKSIAFLLTNNETGEKHIVATDRNGNFSTANSWAPHDQNTNANDEGILADDGSVIYDDKGFIDTSNLDDGAGVWFSGRENADTNGADVDNTLGALPYGTYTLDELRSSSNKGYKLLTGITVEISADLNANPDRGFVDMSTLTDDEDIAIKTTALDKGTGKHIGLVQDEVTLIDTVSYQRATAGAEYTITGVLMDKETGEPLMDAEGMPITAYTTFTADAAYGNAQITFTCSGDAVRGKAMVVFETCYEGRTPVAEHKDIDDDNQTVSYPEIGTQAAFAEVGKVIDTVSYEGLIPGETYVMKAHLIDKESGKAIPGTESEKEFKADEASGTVEVEIDCTNAAGFTAVVFEECCYEDVLIGEHKDADDENQTVDIPKLGTTASLVGDNQIVDTVAYEKLIPGAEYTMYATLVDKATGREIKDKNATIDFIPEAPYGTVKVPVEATELDGRTVVVFEECMLNGKVVAQHKDIHYEGQTVKMPGNPSIPITGDHSAALSVFMIAVLALATALFAKKEAAK